MAVGRVARARERYLYIGGCAFAVIGALLYNAPAEVAGFDLPMPWLPLAPVFYWGMLRPDLSRAVTAFVLGLFQDFVSGGPLGVWALAYLVAFSAAAPQRGAMSGQTAGAVWIGFVLFVAVAGTVAFGAGWLSAQFRPALDLEGLGLDPSVIGQRDIRPGPAVAPLVLEAAVTMLLGPLIARPLGGFTRITTAGRGL
ncbi:MAG: rod shape-determining protein MreD [Maricaulaceae bacterium]|jgi:rod shape-determining protein MreD